MKTDSLEKIAFEVKGCPLCKLARSRKNAVPGEGQISARILIVGEAPGKNEDEKGKPFVGAAGRILDGSLRKCGFDKSEIFITNIVKCRPPDNRIPEVDEIAACRGYLERQISLINPKIICILGRTAYSSLLDGRFITQNRGKIIKKGGRKYFLTIHPAATIYNRSMLSAFEDDLLKLMNEIKKMTGMDKSGKSSLEDYL